MIKVYETITGLKKAATKREAEKKELADVVEQEKLVEMKGELLSARRGQADVQAVTRTLLKESTLVRHLRARRRMETWRFTRTVSASAPMGLRARSVCTPIIDGDL
jgi:nucleosome binding factor SPN SPT16 subunit